MFSGIQNHENVLAEWKTKRQLAKDGCIKNLIKSTDMILNLYLIIT